MRARVRVAHARSRHRSAVPHGMPRTAHDHALLHTVLPSHPTALIPQRSLSRRLHVHACARPPSLLRGRSSGLRFMAACADCARGAVDHARAWRRQGRRHAAHRHARPAWHMQLELPLSGSDVAADDGDNGARVHRAATIERGLKPSVVVTERYPHEREPSLYAGERFSPTAACASRFEEDEVNALILRPLFYLVATSPVPPRFDRVRPLVPRGSTY